MTKESKLDDARQQEKPAIRQFDANLLARRIEEKLGFVRFEHETTYFLKTGSKRCNAVFGSRDSGIPYGKLIEIRGPEHGGKTTIATILAGEAQQDGAGIGRIDLEESQDDAWDIRLGLDPKNVCLIKPQIGYAPKVKTKKGVTVITRPKITKDSIPVMKSAEQIFAEAQMAMHMMRKLGFEKQFWFVDSIAQLRTKMQIKSGGIEKNMRSANDRAMFLSDVLPEWVALAAGYNATIFFINQLRNSMAMFGDPLTSPGGRALRHNCHCQVNVHKVKNGKIIQAGKKVGIMGKLVNFKNKMGHGSESDCVCGFKVRWDTSPIQVQYMSVDSLTEE